MLNEASAQSKKDILLNMLSGLDSLLVAFSGGVDSAFLLAVAREAITGHVMAVTAVSPIHPRCEQAAAANFVRARSIAHTFLQTNEINIPEFVGNGADRCYHCKRALFTSLREIASVNGITSVAHGANSDDLKDYRPGLKAAEEAGIIAPLMDARLSKSDIRFLAREMGLTEWNKPAMACLATRFPYGHAITEEGLRRVEEAEAFLLEQGFRSPRVRHHGTVARIELAAGELPNAVTRRIRRAIVERLRSLGFDYVSLDLEGYMSGKMNRSLETEPSFGDICVAIASPNERPGDRDEP